MPLPKSSEVTNLFLFGQVTTPTNLVDDSLIRLNPLPSNPALTVDIQAFMNPKTGPGRFAVGSQFELIQKFFDPGFFTRKIPPLPPNKQFYTKQEIATFLKLSKFELVIQQLDFEDNLDDYAERTYIFNTLAFQISDSAKFIVKQNGDRFIEDFSIEPRRDKQDNFDFVGGGFITNLGNSTLKKNVDPSVIGRTVNINYTLGSSPKVRYDKNSYKNNQNLVDSWENGSLIKLNADILELTNDLFKKGVTKFLDGNKPIFYGTNADNDLSAPSTTDRSKAAQYPTLAPYFRNGSVLIGGAGQDRLLGNINDDKLFGGSGNDSLLGGTGKDIGVFSEGFDNYSFTKVDKTSWAIQHTSGSGTDGKDTLQDVEETKFSDTTIGLTGGADTVFAIDVSGSMGDDIASVKAQSTKLLEAIFGKNNQSVDNRVGILTFNDTDSINAVLNFTDQASITERKQAALSGIQKVSILGGGEEPLNGALLFALNNGLGNWRSDATKRRIIVFSDETPADPLLASDVQRKSADLDVKIEDGNTLSPSRVTRSSVTVQSLTATPNANPVSVEIFTVAIGNSRTTIDALQKIADNNRGKAFRAENASQLVDVLLQAIQAPPTTIPKPTGSRITGTNKKDTLKGTPYDDILSGKGGIDKLIGRDGNDVLLGDQSNDKLSGGAGNDTLSGGKDNDLLSGGEGTDIFAFNAKLTGEDVVKDFRDNSDTLAFIGVKKRQLNFEKIGQDTLISWGKGNEVLIKTSKPSQFQNDLVFVDNFAALGRE